MKASKYLPNTEDRYEMLTEPIRSGKVKSFKEVLKVIPKTVIARDMGLKNDLFDKYLENMEKFSLRYFIKLSKKSGMPLQTWWALYNEDISRKLNGFTIEALVNGKAEQITIDKFIDEKATESYEVRMGGLSMVIQTDRRAWRLKGEKASEVDWVVLRGHIGTPQEDDIIINAVERADPDI